MHTTVAQNIVLQDTPITKRKDMENLDETDIRILRALQRNAKLTVKELAAEVHLSPSPTFERQKRLEREGYIRRYVARLDAHRLGTGIVVLCNVRLKQHNKEIGSAFMKAVQSIDEVVSCYNTSGDYDFLMKLYVRDMAHYQDFVLNTLGEIDSIGSLHSIFVIGTVKEADQIPIHITPKG